MPTPVPRRPSRDRSRTPTEPRAIRARARAPRTAPRARELLRGPSARDDTSCRPAQAAQHDTLVLHGTGVVFTPVFAEHASEYSARAGGKGLRGESEGFGPSMARTTPC